MKVGPEGMLPLSGWKAHLLTALAVVSGLVGAALLIAALAYEGDSSASTLGKTPDTAILGQVQLGHR